VPFAAGAAMAIAGASAAAVRRVVAGSGRGPPADIGLIVVGCLVAALAWAGRVTGFVAGDTALAIRYRARRAFVAPWADVLELVPPRWPLGGWSLAVAFGSRVARRVLMPSDVLGNEALLALVIERAGLSFDGRRWTRPPALRSPRASPSSAGDARRSGRSTNRAAAR
jgi:hypothetical protein